MLRIVTYGLMMMCAITGVLWAAEGDTEESAAKPSHRVVVYYLHNTWRCLGCNSVESLSKAAVLGGKGENTKTGTEMEVQSSFASDIAAGHLSFESVNIDPKEKKQLLETLGNNLKVPIVVELKNGKVVAFKALKQAWSYLGDNRAFVKYVQDGVEPVLEKVRPKPADGDQKE